jgi:AraC-like DNA-binding protein
MRVWQTIRASAFGRHCHNEAYAAVVLSGCYEEAGDRGRFWVEAGDVILHDRFEAHLDRFPGSGAVVLNLGLHSNHSFTPGAWRVADPDLIIRTAEQNRAKASELLLLTVNEYHSKNAEWPDELAAAIIQDPSMILSQWAELRCLKPWAVSRGFYQVFGITPEAFRARTRAIHAWKAIQTTPEPLAQIACNLGFADQAHMTRGVKHTTGMAPAAWRTVANRYKTRERFGL